MSNTKKIKNYCRQCQSQTNHSVLFKKVVNPSEDYHCSYIYMTVECAGCESVSYRTDFEDYESAYPDEYDQWQHDTTTTTYPSILFNHKGLSNTYILPEKIRIVYLEAIEAFKNNCFLLTGVAFRAIIEAICIDREIKGNNLEVKINKLAKSRLITDKEGERLHSIRFIGNDSVHEMSVPRKDTLYLVLNIIEHLLNNLYIIDYETKDSLETIINEFDDFKGLLNKNLKQYEQTEELPLSKFFGKDVRRIKGKISDFETELIEKINKGEYTELTVGKKDKYKGSKEELQHFIKK